MPASLDVGDRVVDVPGHLLPDVGVLGLDLGVREAAFDQQVADVVPVSRPLEHLAEHGRAGVAVEPEVVVADDAGDLARDGVVGEKVDGGDPAAATGRVDPEQVDPLADGVALLLVPAVVVPPLDPPPVQASGIEGRHGRVLVPEVRDGEKVATARQGCEPLEEGRKLADRGEDREDVPVPPPVDRVGPDGIEVVVGQVDHADLPVPGRVDDAVLRGREGRRWGHARTGGPEWQRKYGPGPLRSPPWVFYPRRGNLMIRLP